jgi:DNA-binding Xre family transcriptional regulator
MMYNVELGGKANMIRSKFDRLRREKAATENRDISLRTVATETGLALGTVLRLNKGQVERVYLTTLDTLCKYFQLQEIGQLIEYIPDEEKGDTVGAEK